MARKIPMNQTVVENITAEELGALQPRNCERVLKAMNAEQRIRMMIEVEKQVFRMEAALDLPNTMISDRHTFRCTNPYTEMKKYAHIYTILSGWMTKDDLTMRELVGKARWEISTEVLEEFNIQVAVGDPIVVKDGPFQNFEGRVVSVNLKDRKIGIQINMFGRTCDIQIDFMQVAKIA